jgi:hypothetical protein
MILSYNHEIMKVAVGDEPHPEQLAAYLSFFGEVCQLLAIVLSEVLQIASIKQDYDGDRYAIELE